MKTLTKEHGLLNVEQSAPGVWEDSLTVPSNGWRIVDSAGVFVSDTYFDLAGMSIDEKTLFFEAAGVQEVRSPEISPAVPGNTLVVGDFMTTTPLTDIQVSQVVLTGNMSRNAPAEFQNTIYGRINQWVHHIETATFTGMTLQSSNQIGSMSPTASDRIYSYRVVIIASADPSAQFAGLTPARHILRATAKSEPDHEYIMRLLRSYQLQQEPDVD
ncbi:MAG: hypothetical protein ACR2NF_10380 [Pirellulales bacterium]